ncbi:MAG TPA: deoxyribonuclease V [Chloroflexi bacterium]|nr:deoxyribonuclease V [Chloroflexota bacterium]
MRIKVIHRWNVSPQEAIAIQERLRPAVIDQDKLGRVRYVAGLDIGFQEKNTITRAAVAVLTYPDLQLVEHIVDHRPTSFPYVPGLLSFREAPAALDALAKLEIRPDLLLCDGQGLAHPRRFGLACHIGLLADIPAVGVAKTRLIGQHEPVLESRGSWQPLWHEGEMVGAVLRTRTNVKPVYVSIGHRISLETAIEYVMACTPKYRLPETTRWAHRLASGQVRA